MNLGLIPSPQFVMMRFDLLDSEQFDLMHPQAIKLYLKLRRFIWRSADKGRLAEHFARGNLAVEGYCPQWAEWLQTSRSTAGRMVKELEDAGWLVRAYQSRGREDPNILYLGFWVEVGEDRLEIYFADTTSPKETVAARRDTRAPVQDTRAPMHGTRAPVHTSNKEGTNRELNTPTDGFSDLWSPHAPPEPSVVEKLIAEKKATLTDEQFGLWQASGGPAQLYAEHGGSYAVPPDAGGADDMGTRLYKAFQAHTGIRFNKPREAEQWTRHLREIATGYPGLTVEMAVEAMEVTFLDNFTELKTRTPFFGFFEDGFKKALSCVIEGTLDSYRRELTSGGVRVSETGREGPTGGASEDQKARREAGQRIARAGRERALKNMPPLPGATDP